MPKGIPNKKLVTVDISRTPLDTLDQAITDLDRQLAAKQQEIKVSEKLKEALTASRERAFQMLTAGRIRLLPPNQKPDTATRNLGFLGAGLAARGAEIITVNGSPLHVKAIHAQVTLQPGLESVSIESLRATLMSDTKRTRPRLVALGEGFFGLYGVHDTKAHKRSYQRRLKAA